MNADVAIVTGANDGIGLYTVGMLLEDDYRVAGLDLGAERMGRWGRPTPRPFYHWCAT